MSVAILAQVWNALGSNLQQLLGSNQDGCVFSTSTLVVITFRDGCTYLIAGLIAQLDPHSGEYVLVRYFTDLLVAVIGDHTVFEYVVVRYLANSLIIVIGVLHTGIEYLLVRFLAVLLYIVIGDHTGIEYQLVRYLVDHLYIVIGDTTGIEYHLGRYLANPLDIVIVDLASFVLIVGPLVCEVCIDLSQATEHHEILLRHYRFAL
eukprot:1956640-Amphidinium_carterae.1